MSQNPFQAPKDDAPAPRVRKTTVDPETGRAIGDRIKRLFRNSLIISGLGLLLQLGAYTPNEPAKPPTFIIGTIVLIYGLSLYARMRNRSPAWALLGLFSCLGVLFTRFLAKKCHHCGATTKGKTCDECGAPAPV